VGDAPSMRRHVGSAISVYVLFFPFLAVVGVLLVWFSPSIANAPPEDNETVRIACALLVVNFLLANLAALPEGVLRGMNLGYKRIGLQAGLSVVGGSLAAVALYLGTGLPGLAAAEVVLSALTGVLFWIVVKKYVSWFGSAWPTVADLRRFIRLSFW